MGAAQAMAKPSDFEIVTFQRKAGRWRASISPKRALTTTQGKVMLSFVTDEDADSELDAVKAASEAIRSLSL